MTSHREFGLIRVRYLFGLLYSYLIASVEVIAILRLIAGARVHVVAALAVSMIGSTVGACVMAATLSSTLAWYRRGATPTQDQRTSASMLPYRHARLHGAVWVAVGIGLLAVHRAAGPQILCLIGIAMLLVTVASGFMGFLLLQRLLRPVYAVR
jgi:hypothetical protein